MSKLFYNIKSKVASSCKVVFVICGLFLVRGLFARANAMQADSSIPVPAYEASKLKTREQFGTGIEKEKDTLNTKLSDELNISGPIPVAQLSGDTNLLRSPTPIAKPRGLVEAESIVAKELEIEAQKSHSTQELCSLPEKGEEISTANYAGTIFPAKLMRRGEASSRASQLFQQN